MSLNQKNITKKSDPQLKSFTVNPSSKKKKDDKKNKLVKLMCWNKGNSRFETKKDELEMLIEEHYPLMLGVLEANVEKDYFLPALNINGYSTELDNLRGNGNKTRTTHTAIFVIQFKF